MTDRIWNRNAEFAVLVLVREIGEAATMQHIYDCAMALVHVRAVEKSLTRAAHDNESST